MAERNRYPEKVLKHKKTKTSSFENNRSTNAHKSITLPPRSENSAISKLHKVASKPVMKNKGHAESFTIERQKISEIEQSNNIVTPVKTQFFSSRTEQNMVGNKNSSCSSSPVRRRVESPLADREANGNVSSFAQPVKKFIPSLNNAVFFKQLFERIMNRYPEYVQRIWKKNMEEQRKEYLKAVEEMQIANNANEHLLDDEGTLKPISEEDQDSIFRSLSSASDSETSEFSVGNEHLAVAVCEQRSSLSSGSFRRNCSAFPNEYGQVIEWREWSLQLSDGKLIITGKSEQNTLTKSEDVSSWERVDAHTLKHPTQGLVYKLVGAADHFVCQDLPSYVRTKFQYGFPEKWLEIKDMWMEYRKRGNPSNFVWSPDTDYNRVKPRLNNTFTARGTHDMSHSDNIARVTSSSFISHKSKTLHFKKKASEGDARLSKGDAMRDLSNITFKRPMHKVHSLCTLSQKTASEINFQPNDSPKKKLAQDTTESNPEKELTKDITKASKTSKKKQSEPQALKNWFPVLTNDGLKISGILESKNEVSFQSPVVAISKVLCGSVTQPWSHHNAVKNHVVLYTSTSFSHWTEFMYLAL